MTGLGKIWIEVNHSDETPNLQYSEDVIGQKIELIQGCDNEKMHVLQF